MFWPSEGVGIVNIACTPDSESTFLCVCQCIYTVPSSATPLLWRWAAEWDLLPWCWAPWHACSGAPASQELWRRGRKAQWWGWLLPSGWTRKTLTCPTPAASTCCPSSQQRSRRTTSTPGRKMTRESFRTTWRYHMTSPSALRTTTPSVLPMAAGTTGARAARARKFELGN